MNKAIIFDCFGTLIGTSYFTLRQLCPPDRLQELHDIRLSSDYGYITRAQYIERISQLLSIDQEEVRTIIDQKHTRNQELIDQVKKHKSAYKTALLSNVGANVMETIFSEAELEELFDVVVLSHQVGLVKPDQHIYEITVEKLGVEASDCIMIDDREEFCAGAIAVGIEAILHHNNQETISQLDQWLAKT